MCRQVYLLGVGLLVVALAFVVTQATLRPRPGVTEANVRRIREGMTLGKVESILGGPSRSAWDMQEGRVPRSGEPRWVRNWDEKGLSVQVWFSTEEVVIWAIVLDPNDPRGWRDVQDVRPQLSRLARLRAWLGW